MRGAEFLIFGPYPDEVQRFARSAKEICEKKGVESGGPSPMPNVTFEEDNPAFNDDNDADLFGQPPTEEECQVLPGKKVIRRKLLVYNSDAVEEIASKDLPENVFMRVVIREKPHGDGSGASFSYDPILDYKTEL